MNNIVENETTKELQISKKEKIIPTLLAASGSISIAFTICYCATVFSNLSMGYTTKVILNEKGFKLKPIQLPTT